MKAASLVVKRSSRLRRFERDLRVEAEGQQALAPVCGVALHPRDVPDDPRRERHEMIGGELVLHRPL